MSKWFWILLLFSSCSTHESKPPEILDQIKLIQKSKGYFIPIKVGKKSHILKIDSRKSSTSITKTKIKKIGYKKYTEGKKTKECFVLKADYLKISRTEFKEYFFEDCGENYISLEFFNPHVVELDFKSQNLKFLSHIGGGFFGTSSLKKNKNGDFLFKFFIGSKPISAVLDTRLKKTKISVDFINKNPKFFKKIGKASYKTEVFGKNKKIKLNIERVHFSDSAKKNLSAVDAVIGLDVLKNYSLVLDVKKKKYQLKE